MKVISSAPPRGRCGNNSGRCYPRDPLPGNPASIISKLSFDVTCNEANLAGQRSLGGGREEKNFFPVEFYLHEPDKQDTTNTTLKVRATSHRL